MVWASRWSVALRTFYRQILSLTYSFFSLKLPPPACPALLVLILYNLIIARLFTLRLTQAQCDLGQMMWQMMTMEACLDPRMSKVLASFHELKELEIHEEAAAWRDLANRGELEL